MTDVVVSPPAADVPPTDPTEALVERLFTATIDSLEIASVHLGSTLGFYRALADGGDATPGELAARTATTERYVREWLEQQAVAGFLAVDDPDAEAGDRRYSLPAAHRAVLVDEEDPSYLAPISTLAVGVCWPIEHFSGPTGAGTASRTRPTEPRLARGSPPSTGPCSSTSLPGGWPPIPEVDARLRRTPPARVADLACGPRGRASPSRAPTRT